MATVHALQKLDDQLNCPICLARMTDPRALPCQHASCKHCIDQLPRKNLDEPHVVECPICREAVNLGEKGASSLRKAFHINNLLEIDEILRKTPTNKPSADRDADPSCPKHANEPPNIFCETCEELICYKCVYTDTHKRHKTDLADNCFEKHKQQIRDCLKPIDYKIGEATRTLSDFDDTKRAIRDKSDTVKQEVVEAIKRDSERLLAAYNSLLESKIALFDQIESGTLQKLEVLSLERAELETVLVELKSCKKLVEDKLESQTQYQIQSSKNELIQSVYGTHSKLKVSTPKQKADTAFSKDSSAQFISEQLCAGKVQCVADYQSVCGLFKVDIPECVPAWLVTEISLTTISPFSLPPEVLQCKLISQNWPAVSENTKCMVVKDKEEKHFKIILKPEYEKIGLHYQLSVLIGEGSHYSCRHVHGSPFPISIMPLAEWRTKRIKIFANGLISPCGVAITDDEKHVVIAEANNRVTVFSSAGEVIRRFKGSSLNDQIKIAVSADNGILVSDGKGIRKYDLSGHAAGSLGDDVCGMAVLPSGSVIAYSCTKWMICKISPDLEKVETLVQFRVGFDEVTDIAVDSKGCVYLLSNLKSGHIHKLSPEGKHISSFGKELSNPYGLCIDSSNVIYVSDGQRVKMFTTDGKAIGGFGKFSKLQRGIAVSKTGNLYFCLASGEVLVSTRNTQE